MTVMLYNYCVSSLEIQKCEALKYISLQWGIITCRYLNSSICTRLDYWTNSSICTGLDYWTNSSICTRL